MNCQKIFIVTIFLLGLSAASGKAEIIAYSQLTDGFWQIWTMDEDGRNKRQITFSAEDKRSSFWIEQQKRLGYRTANGEIFTVDLQGKEKEEILAPYKPLSNPDAASATGEIVFVRFHPSSVDVGDIWKADLAAKETVILTKDEFLSFQPRISDDGATIVFVKLDKDRDHQIWMMNADGTRSRQLTNVKGRCDFPDISSDGRKVIFTSDQDSGDFDLFQYDTETAKVSRLLKKPGMQTSPRFSIDDERIAFVSNESGQKHIWVMKTNGEDLRPLTFDAASIDPVWIESEM